MTKPSPRRQSGRTRVSVSRRVALRVLRGVLFQGDYANLALRREWERHAIGQKDRAFATQLVYGVLRHLLRIDHGLAALSRHPLDRLPEPILLCLRMGAFELFHMDQVPARATVHEYVSLAAIHGHQGTAHLVNAILRRIANDPQQAMRIPDTEDDVVRLSVAYSHPAWLVSRWIRQFGIGETEALLKFNNTEAPLTIRLHPSVADSADLDALIADDWRRGRWCPSARHLRGWRGLRRLEECLPPAAYCFQDEGSMLVTMVLDPRPGETVVDLCAGPGGKTLHIAERVRGRGEVIAVEPNPSRARAIRTEAEARNMAHVQVVESCAESFAESTRVLADRCLVDVPCTGTGVLRRRPDIRWRRSEDSILELVQTQRAILWSAAQIVRPGGVLVYSTCSLEEEEDQKLVEAFLAEHEEYEPAPFMVSGKPTHQWLLLPHRTETDGMFVVRLRRRSTGTFEDAPAVDLPFSEPDSDGSHHND